MKPFVICDHKRYQINTWAFPDSCRGVNVNTLDHCNNKDLVLVTRLRTSDDIMQMLMIVDAIKRNIKPSSITLKAPYIPYSRQDRVCNEGDSLSIAVVAKIINSCDFREVITFDPHSNVLCALIDRLTIIDQSRISPSIIFDCVVAPDNGAVKRAVDYANRWGVSSVAVADKIRDMKTGEIIDYQFRGDVEGKSVLVVDDILDGGRTFEELSTQLKKSGCNNASLFVTHGMFTKGFDVCKLFETVYTTNSYRDFDDVYVKNLKVIDVYK